MAKYQGVACIMLSKHFLSKRFEKMHYFYFFLAQFKNY